MLWWIYASLVSHPQIRHFGNGVIECIIYAKDVIQLETRKVQVKISEPSVINDVSLAHRCPGLQADIVSCCFRRFVRLP